MNQIEGFEEEISTELQNRAKTWLEGKLEELKAKQKELSIKDDLVEFEGLTPDMIIKMGEADIKSLDDFADLATDELVEILGEETLTNNDSERLIMAAREQLGWFAEEETAAEDVATEQTEALASNG